ncbi:MAG: butyrate kinase [Bacteroidales bacterium]|nr:butyrate kinase [Bacteroidales bacterium]
MHSSRVLVINPKNTSTKIAVFKNAKLVFLKTIQHNKEELGKFNEVTDQLDLRRNAIMKELRDNEIRLKDMKVIIARGGLLKPLDSGVYKVNKRMKEDLLKGIMGKHAVNLGGLLADDIAAELEAEAYIADPVVVDELGDLARISGHPKFDRKSIFHALNQKVVARKYAKSINRKYEELDLIVVHIGGGGTSVGAHKNGRVIDANQAFDGDGPFSIERTGTLPVGDLVRLCFSGEYSQEEIIHMITTEGGFAGYLGTTSVHEIEDRIAQGDKEAELYTNAMAYQLSKEIGGMCMVTEGKPDAIILSGDIFHNKSFTNYVSSRVSKIGPIAIYPNEDEVEALAINADRVLRGETEVLEYK